MGAEAQASQAHSEVLQQGSLPFLFVLQQAFFAKFSRRPDKLQIGKRDTTIARGQGADALASEMGFRRSLLKLATGLEIAELARREGKTELGFPAGFGNLALHDHDVSHSSNTKSLAVLFLLDI